MAFKSEEELQTIVSNSIFYNLCNILKKSDSIHKLEEVPYASGRTDLVIAHVSENYLENRLKHLELDAAILKDSYLRLYITIKNKGKFDLNILSRLNRSKRMIVLESIRWLTYNEYIENDGEILKIKDSFKKHITTTYAFELKLKDWKNALKQSFGAKTYSNFQYVILDDDFIKPALKNIDMFYDLNIGLISVTKNSNFEIFHRPKKSKPCSKIGEWRFNEYSLRNIMLGVGLHGFRQLVY